MDKICIGDACEILNGYAFKSEKYVEDGIRVIRIANVQKGYIEDNTPAFYPIDSTDLERYMLEEGDLLMSLTGNVGRVAILEKKFLPAALNQRVACLRLKTDKISKGYLFHILNNDFFERQCVQSSKGVAQKNMSTEWLKNYEIPLCTKEKQIEIEGMLNKVSEIITFRKNELQKLDDLIKARFVEMFGDPVLNDMNWDKTTLLGSLQAGRTVTYGIVQTGDDVEGGVPVFRPIDIAGGNVPKRESLKRTLPEISAKYQRTLLMGMELLVTVRGSIGETFQTSNEFKGCNVGRNIVPLVTNNRYVNQRFLQELFAQEPIKKWLKGITKGIALQGLNMSEFKDMPVIVPPMETQRSFVAFVEQVDKSKVVIQESLNKTQLLFDSLMQKYFG